MARALAVIAFVGAVVSAIAPAIARPAMPDAVGLPSTGTGPAQPTSCPITADACALAEQVEGWLRAGDVGALVAHLASREYECPGAEPQGLGGPFPLCDGATADERRSGHVLGFYQSEGVVISTEEYAGTIERWLSEVDAGSVDQFGSGAVRLVSLGCPTAGFPDSCAGVFRVVVSFRAHLPDFRAPTRFAVVFTFEQVPGAGAPRITYTLFGFTFPAPVYRGGTVEGMTYVPWGPSVGALPPVGTGLTADRRAGGWTVLAAGTLVIVAVLTVARISRAGGGPRRTRSGGERRNP
jgi:hypothetical protein